jgi:hypothetical protein
MEHKVRGVTSHYAPDAPRRDDLLSRALFTKGDFNTPYHVVTKIVIGIKEW